MYFSACNYSRVSAFASEYRPGLEGIIAARTALSHVEGERGALTVCGFAIEDLAPNYEFEQVTYLMLKGQIPTDAELAEFSALLASRRVLTPMMLDLLRESVEAGVKPIDAMRAAAGLVSTSTLSNLREADWEESLALIAIFPSLAAAIHRLRVGKAPIAPRSDLKHVANYLWMLSGDEPEQPRVRALETYLNTVLDHGLNASTFTARVIASTESDAVSAVVGAIGALKGQLHGGAPGPALAMVEQIGTIDRAEPFIRAKLAAGEKLMGFGHRIYKVRDPRADVLKSASEKLFESGMERGHYELALQIEQVVLRLLEEFKPGRGLQTNVEFYTALLLDGIGLTPDLFTPTFACGRAVGWLAHVREQRISNRVIRPLSEYIGTHPAPKG